MMPSRSLALSPLLNVYAYSVFIYNDEHLLRSCISFNVVLWRREPPKRNETREWNGTTTNEK